ncbi:MAG: lysine--tRNA ligase [Candidatus Thermoplasmatota archaeon]
MHWAEVVADRLLSKNKKHVLATGITPSGPIHIGNMREILTTDAIYRCLLEKDGEADFIYIADDYDPLRRVYPYLPKSYEEHVGKPIYEIPCPCGGHKSYADHYLESFLSALEEIGVKPLVYRASEMYNKGIYSDAIQIALENTERIRYILESISKRVLPKEWLPFNIQCQNCRRLSTTQPLLYEDPIIEYKCSCGYHDEIDIRKPGVGKLPWRVDWPARWGMLKVTFEPCGKDLATVGGARETGARISEEVYDYPHPDIVVYEFIMLKGQGAMHSSKGTALSAEEMLKMTPPEVLRFLIMRNQPEKHIVFDPGLGILDLVDEYDQFERIYFKVESEIKGLKDIEETYKLSQPYNTPEKLPHQIPYRHLVTLIQIGETWKEIKKILVRTKQIPEDLSKQDEKRIRQRIEHVKYWLNNFAPESVKFTVQKNLPDVTLTDNQRRFLLVISKKIDKINWDSNEIHNTIYQVAEEEKIPPQECFHALYKIILGKDKGPRAGYFLSNLDKNFVKNMITDAVK